MDELMMVITIALGQASTARGNVEELKLIHDDLLGEIRRITEKEWTARQRITSGGGGGGTVAYGVGSSPSSDPLTVG